MGNFEQASRLKLRFATTKGLLSTEDLWELSLTSLDSIAKTVNKKIKEDSEESFITTRSKADKELVLSLDILKRVIEVKIQEAEDKKNKTEKAAQLSLLKELKANKQLQELQSLTSQEIEDRINALES